MGTSTFCTAVRFCTRSCNFALHRPLGFEPNRPATETVRCCNRSELRPHLPKLRWWYLTSKSELRPGIAEVTAGRCKEPKTQNIGNYGQNLPTACVLEGIPEKMRGTVTPQLRKGVRDPFFIFSFFFIFLHFFIFLFTFFIFHESE